MNNELKAVKVVLFCAAAQDSADSAYGDRGFIGRDLARMADVPIEYRGFGGLLKGDARSEFLAAANDADVVLLDAWCNSQLYPDCERPQRDMANNAERIKADNPRAFVLAELMEGVHKVAVHEVATPFVDWTDPEVIAAIKLASRLKNMDSETLILVVDDDERNLAAAKKQLVNLGLL
ncbi:MAG: hypothetical protein NTY66_04040, partial [Candidatus Vogelbacteria bacterium]|nr:hypothetical protein [Candidatus Vogelbacteria bacterium]